MAVPQIVSTRNGASSVTNYRDDLVAADLVGLSLSSYVGVTSVLWELVGRPEGSAAGGAGPEPIFLANANSAAFNVDSDAGAFRLDGTYIVQATINPGSPGRVRVTAALCRLSGLTIPGAGSSVRVLRKLGGFEALEDKSVPTILQGWATELNRWLELLRATVTGGAGGFTTLEGAYSHGASSSDQTLSLLDAVGGGVVIDGSGGGFTGASALKVLSAAGGPFVVDRATGRVGVGIAAPLQPVHVKGTAPAVRLDRTGGAALDLMNVDDELQFLNGALVLAKIEPTGGLRADLGVGIGTAPATAAVLALGAASTAPISASGQARFRYNEVTGHAEWSENGGAYQPFATTASAYQTIDANGTPLTRRTVLNFGPEFTAVDNSGASRTDVSVAAISSAKITGIANTVPYFNGAGAMAEATTALSFDPTNTRMGSRISSGLPLFQLHLVDEAGAADRGLLIGTHINGSTGPAINFQTSQGTYGSPTSVGNTKYLGRFAWNSSRNGANYLKTAELGAHVTSGSTVTSGSIPTDLFLHADPGNSGVGIGDLYGTPTQLALVVTNSQNGGVPVSGLPIVGAGFMSNDTTWRNGLDARLSSLAAQTGVMVVAPVATNGNTFIAWQPISGTTQFSIETQPGGHTQFYGPNSSSGVIGDFIFSEQHGGFNFAQMKGLGLYVGNDVTGNGAVNGVVEITAKSGSTPVALALSGAWSQSILKYTSGDLSIGISPSSSGNLNFVQNTGTVGTIDQNGQWQIMPSTFITTPTNTSAFKLILAAASMGGSGVEYVDMDISANRILGFGTVLLPSLQRSSVFRAPTYATTGGSGTIATAVNVYIDRAPQAGSGMTLTNSYALWVAAGGTRLGGSIFADGLNAGGMTKSLVTSGQLAVAVDGTDYLSPATIHYQTVAEAGSNLTRRTVLNFDGTVVATDSSSPDRTNVGLPNIGPGAGTIGTAGISSVTLDAQGRVSAATTATYLTSAFYQTIKNSAGTAQTQRANLKFLSDFAVADATPDTTVALATQGGFTAGSFTNTNVTVNQAGVITAISNGSAGSAFYQTIANTGSALTQRNVWNASTGLTAVDNSGATRTDVTVNLSTGISGGQSAIGGTATTDSLLLKATSATPASGAQIQFQNTSNFIDATAGSITLSGSGVSSFTSTSTTATAFTITGASSGYPLSTTSGQLRLNSTSADQPGMTATKGSTMYGGFRFDSGSVELFSTGGYLFNNSATALSTVAYITNVGRVSVGGGASASPTGMFEATDSSGISLNMVTNADTRINKATGGNLRVGSGVSTSVTLYTQNIDRQVIDLNGLTTLTPGVVTTGSPTLWKLTGPAHTTLTASTEATDVNFALNRTVQFATGNITTQRAFRIQAPTYGFVGASTLTNAATFYVDGAPAAATNATITNSYAVWVAGGAVRLDGLGATGFVKNTNGGILSVDTSTYLTQAYSTVQANASSLTQRNTLNFSTDLPAVDNSGSARTDVSLLSVGTPGTYGGSGTFVRQIVTDAKGRVTSATASTGITPSATYKWSNAFVNSGTGLVAAAGAIVVPADTGNMQTTAGLITAGSGIPSAVAAAYGGISSATTYKTNTTYGAGGSFNPEITYALTTGTGAALTLSLQLWYATDLTNTGTYIQLATVNTTLTAGTSGGFITFSPVAFSTSVPAGAHLFLVAVRTDAVATNVLVSFTWTAVAELSQ